MTAQALTHIWHKAVDAVRGSASVANALGKLPTPPDRIIAVGKAACDMARPAMEAFPGTPVTIVTKHGHASSLPGPATVIEAGHPVPDAQSLIGGAALLEAVGDARAHEHLLCLVSGGASAVAEALPKEMTLAAWRAETERLVASGADIHAINARRREVSLIKNGKLLGKFGGARITTLAISDVEGDDLNVIGSGIGNCPDKPNFIFESHLVATNAIAREAAAAASSAPIICNEEMMYEDVHTLAPKLAQKVLNGRKGLYIFGGEPTVILPENPGRGGRNQALALLIAREIAGQNGITALVGGTDGTDGPTPDAGGMVNAQTWTPEAQANLDAADAGTFLQSRDALFTTGPTGTNVMDLCLFLKT